MSQPSQRAGRERAAELRAQQERQEKQRKQIIFAVAGLLVVAIGVVVAFAISQGSGKEKGGDTGSTVAAPKVAQTVFDKVGAPAGGAQTAKPAKVAGAKLMDGDKAKVVYIGAEYCPYCGGERWALMTALQRFGTFDAPLATTRTPGNEGNVPTVKFTDVAYTSDYVTFNAWETQDAQGNKLQDPPADIMDAFKKYNPGGGIPWTWFGNAAIGGSGVPVPPLSQLSGTDAWQKISAEITAGTGEIGTAVDQHANVITAQICQQTGGKPATVCSSAGVKAAEGLVVK